MTYKVRVFQHFDSEIPLSTTEYHQRSAANVEAASVKALYPWLHVSIEELKDNVS